MENEICGNCEHYRSEVDATSKSGAISVLDEGSCRRFPVHAEVGSTHSCAEFAEAGGDFTADEMESVVELVREAVQYGRVGTIFAESRIAILTSWLGKIEA